MVIAGQISYCKCFRPDLSWYLLHTGPYMLISALFDDGPVTVICQHTWTECAVSYPCIAIVDLLQNVECVIVFLSSPLSCLRPDSQCLFSKELVCVAVSCCKPHLRPLPSPVHPDLLLGPALASRDELHISFVMTVFLNYFRFEEQ